jgi:hypothetical protein
MWQAMKSQRGLVLIEDSEEGLGRMATGGGATTRRAHKMRRWYKRLGFCLLAIIFVFLPVAVIIFVIPDEHNYLAYQKLSVGMTKEEAVTIMGSPPGNYKKIPDDFGVVLGSIDSLGRRVDGSVWNFNDGAVVVHWDSEGKLKTKHWHTFPAITLKDRLSILLKRMGL